MINILPLLGVLNPLRGCGDNLDIDFIMKMSTTIYHWCNDVKISKNIYFCRLFYLGANCTLWGYNDNFSKTLFCPLGKEILYLVLLFTALNITILDLNDFWGLLIILCGEGFYPLEGYNIFDLEKKNRWNLFLYASWKIWAIKSKDWRKFFSTNLWRPSWILKKPSGGELPIQQKLSLQTQIYHSMQKNSRYTPLQGSVPILALAAWLNTVLCVALA